MSRVKEFTLPDLGEGLTEGEILSWLVKVGDTIELNQPIVEVETAKAAVEIPAKWAGQVTEIFHDGGHDGRGRLADHRHRHRPGGRRAARAVGRVARRGGDRARRGRRRARPDRWSGAGRPHGRPGRLRTAYDGSQAPPPQGRRRAAPPPPQPPRPPRRDRRRPAAAAPAPPSTSPCPATGRQDQRRRRRPVLCKPPVRKLARDLGVDLRRSPAPGRRARSPGTTCSGRRRRRRPRPSPVAAPVFGPDREQRIPVKGVRKLTADNMVASAFTAPHVTEFLTVDMTRAMKALDRLRVAAATGGTYGSRPLLLVAKARAAGRSGGTRWSTRPGRATRSWSRSTSTSASPPRPSAG